MTRLYFDKQNFVLEHCEINQPVRLKSKDSMF